MRSGLLCVLDISPRTLKKLYNSEFMPFIVAIASPPLEELQQITERTSSGDILTNLDRMKTISEKSERLLKGEHAKFFDLVLVNRNRDVTLRRLADSLERLKHEPQWVPRDWI